VRSEQELRQLALDLKANKIFTSTQIPPEDGDMLGVVFLILSLMNEEQHKEFVAKKPAFVYEYYTEAGERGVNGYPSFMSMRFVTEDELPLLKRFFGELDAFGPPPPEGVYTVEVRADECQVPIGADDVCGLPPDSQIHTNASNPQRHDFQNPFPKETVN
jgi:hypothetical protein